MNTVANLFTCKQTKLSSYKEVRREANSGAPVTQSALFSVRPRHPSGRSPNYRQSRGCFSVRTCVTCKNVRRTALPLSAGYHVNIYVNNPTHPRQPTHCCHPLLSSIVAEVAYRSWTPFVCFPSATMWCLRVFFYRSGRCSCYLLWRMCTWKICKMDYTSPNGFLGLVCY